MTNNDIANHLEEVSFFYSQLSELQRARRFSEAAQNIRYMTEPLSFTKGGTMSTKIKGVGKSIKSTIEEYNKTGTSERYQSLLKSGVAPASVNELTRIPGVGMKTAVAIFKSFNITNLLEFEEQIESIRNSNFNKYIESFNQIKNVSERLPRGLVKSVVDEIMSPLTEIDWMYAGSMRREKPMLRDVDVIVVLDPLSAEKTKDSLRSYFEDGFGLIPDVRSGSDKWGLSIPIGDQLIVLDLNFCSPNQAGSYRNYLTGSKELNIECRKRCKAKGWLLNQKGVFGSEGNQIDDGTEEDLYRLLNVPYVPPECRTGADAVGKDFSNLVTVDDIIIDLHSHSIHSDGGGTWEQMVEAAHKQGLKVLGISDHSHGSGRGLQQDKKLENIYEFNQVRNSFPMRVLYGAEIDARTKVGETDYDIYTVEQLDYALIALHHNYSGNVTERFIAAMEKFNGAAPLMLAHITGRQLGKRPAAEADWHKIFEVCKRTNTIIEVNSQLDRLDAPPELIRAGLEAGVYFAINSDSHGINFRRLLTKGVETARRGWLMKDRCISTNEDLLNRWLEEKLY